MENKTDQPSLLYRYLRRAGYLLVAFSLVLMVLPYIIRYQLIELFRDNGAEQVQIKDVDFNPFTATIAINNMLVMHDQQVSLRVSHVLLKVDWFPVAKRRLVIRKARIQDAELLVELDAQGDILVGGLPVTDNRASPETTDSQPWHAAIESLTLNNSGVRLRLNKQEHVLHIGDVKLDKLQSWDPQNSTQLSMNAILNEAPVALNIDMSLFGDSLGVSGKIHVDGLELHPLIQELYGKLAIKGDVAINLQKDGWLQARHKGDIKLLDSSYTTDELNMKANELVLSGQFGVDIHTGEQAQQAFKLTHTGSAEINRLALNQTTQNVELLAFDQLSVAQINIPGLDQVELAGLELRQLSLLSDHMQEKPVPMVRSELLGSDRIRMDNRSSLNLGNVTLNKLQVSINRNQHGELVPLSAVLAKPVTEQEISSPEAGTDTAVEDPSTDKPAGATEPETGLGLILESLVIKDNSLIQIDDQAVKPVYQSQLQITRAQLGRLDSQQAEQATPLQLELSNRKAGTLKLYGDIYPFTPDHDMDLTLKASSIRLPRLSAYLGQYTGYRIRQGELDSDTSVKASAGELSGSIKVLARNLDMAPASSEQATRVREQLGMPLEQGLDFLRDSDNNIKLDIPLTGNVRNPKFSLSDVINTAITSAIKSGAQTYLLYALGPYGVALAIADKAMSSNGQVKLSDIKYAAGATDLPEENEDYLQRLQKIVQERPGVDLHICGYATERDRVTLHDLQKKQLKDKQVTAQAVTMPADKAVNALASQRMEKLKSRLTSQFNIKPERILLCKPELDKNQSAEPRIEISL